VQVAVETDREVDRILQRARAHRPDLEAWEDALRAAALAAGATVLGGLVEEIAGTPRTEPVRCRCGGRMDNRGRKERRLLTLLGSIPYRRARFQCPHCGATRYPTDEELDVVGTGRSPGLRRIMARAGSQSTFREGVEDLRVYAGLHVSAKDLERVAEAIGHDVQVWLQQEQQALLQDGPPASSSPDLPILYIGMDGTGVPMTRRELRGRKGKQPDGTAKTREAKLGCVFTQTATDKDGLPIRDPDSTSFTGAIESADAFGWRLYAEARRRGVNRAQRVVVLGDGAVWIRNLTRMHFPHATQIVDLYHAREHLAQLCRLLSDGEQRLGKQYALWEKLLDQGNIEIIVEQALQQMPTDPENHEKALKEIHYFKTNKKRMRYAHFRTQGLFIGSGVVEAGCKTLIAQRLKRSGMFWSRPGANAILALRCLLRSGRLENYWESRLAA